MCSLLDLRIYKYLFTFKKFHLTVLKAKNILSTLIYFLYPLIGGSTKFNFFLWFEIWTLYTHAFINITNKPSIFSFKYFPIFYINTHANSKTYFSKIIITNLLVSVRAKMWCVLLDMFLLFVVFPSPSNEADLQDIFMIKSELSVCILYY